MISENTYPSFARAYIEGLRDLLDHGNNVESVRDPTSVGSGFGLSNRPVIELLGYSFEVTNPLSCLFISDRRTVRLPYAFGLLLWSLAGSDSLRWIEYYNQRAEEFSDDGAHLCGAFGKRMFAFSGELNQIDVLLRRLRLDPATRRAFCAVCRPEDNFSNSREYPCCVGTQYFLRNQRLHAITFMRAQSAMAVLPYDAFLFMCVQCILSARLGVEPGSYRHIAGTFHIYESEVEEAREILRQGALPVEVGNFSNADVELPQLLRIEKELRERQELDPCSNLSTFESLSNSFFDQARAVLVVHALQARGLAGGLERAVMQLNLDKPMKNLLLKYVEISHG